MSDLTRLTAVETLSVWWPSPPVPQTSIALLGASIGISRARSARAASAISILVSPRSVSAMRKSAIASSDVLASRMSANA